MLDINNAAIARRATVEDIVAHRNRSLALFAEAHTAIAAASAAIDAAKKEVGSFSSVGTNINTIVMTLWNDGRRANW